MSLIPKALLDDVACYLRLPDSRPAGEIKAEIREELEFHLAMSAEENERAGMPAAEARDQAARRFGDLRWIEATCQTVQLGERSWLQRVQVGLTVAMVAVVAWFAVSSYRNQSRQDTALVGLRQSVEQMRDKLSLIVDRAPPVVVETFPADGALDVDPAATEIRVTFSKEMMDKSWSWCQTGRPFPESTGPIRYAEDNRTCVMPVQLEPGTEYVLMINSERFGNFKDPYGRSAEPYSLCFTTANSR